MPEPRHPVGAVQADLQAVRPRVEAARSAVLATASAEAVPHLIPVVFALRRDAAYIAIDQKPKTTTRIRRLRNIEENPRAALLIDRYDDDWSKLWWIMLRGPAAILDPETRDRAEAAGAIARLRRRYPQYAEHALEDRPLIRLTIEQVTHWSAAPLPPGP